MSNWFVTGWEMFYFIVTPEELEKCLTEFHLVVHNAHVPIDYVETSINSYINMQKQLFELLRTGEKLNWKEHHMLLKQTGLTTELSRCKYGNMHEYQGNLYKRPDFDEPCINFSPFTFYVMEDKNGKCRVSTRVSYTQYPENIIGIELSYPKNIQFISSETGNFEALQSTKTLHSYQDYLLLKSRISDMTRLLSFQIGNRLIKPRVRISTNALESISNFYFFKSHSIKKICGTEY